MSEDWAVPPQYGIEVGTEPLDRPARNSVGGWPYFDDGQEWPRCFCGERMALFFQLDLPDDVEFFGGEHLSVFHCAHHNDASDPITAGGRLVPRFWEAPQPPFPGSFWRVLLQRDPGIPEAEPEPAVRALPLTLRPFKDTYFKVGGTAAWAQEPEYYRCACGAEMAFVCQVPENWGFGVRPGAPVQPYSISDDAYMLFLGNEVYLLACPKRCDPAAVLPVNQH
ncbi:hypothetical protein [Streptomyces griseomycini]|uniref:DUF1963 domain-containing protein n=1 Tax=Streptomyces griseomycini TaxID=66895 RepID=A0A7W7LVL0_9ACTN|nr:hypothetical protein [Streptomyces griseomycini]MBB4897279.1 hypothetical protein [Streptomyces griseomycini]GGP92615.1 hypothetical protein GCM10010266_14200 [Streptomyces griseomycini]GGR33469.1 hypothetical protein GCM10015536_43750 [Streptomyces griseomycini]